MSIPLGDEELDAYVEQEEKRQKNGITLIASENYAFPGVYKYCGSLLTNKYSEGRVGARYYGGTEIIDKIEELCQKRALELFGLEEKAWGVSVQPYSGSIANFSAYSAMVAPGGKIMGLSLPSGGHLTHGFQTKSKKISASSLYFSSHQYEVEEDGRISYEKLEKQFEEVFPEVLICGYSAHSQDIDYKRLREIVRNRGFLYADISHISALVSAGLMNSPFEHCDAVMTTTHKGLRGPRGALIYYKKTVSILGKTFDMDTKINSAVFPLVQGGPHNHTIAAIAHTMKMASTQDFKDYAKQVAKNAQEMRRFFTSNGYKVVTGETVNHMVLLDLKNKEVSGEEVETVCEALGISVNKNSVPKDISVLRPSGVRLGTYAITTRGMREPESKKVAELVDLAVKSVQSYKKTKTSKTIKQWISEEVENNEDLRSAKNTVINLTQRFKIPL